MRVLVVDDSRAQRMFIKNALKELGYDVLEAPNGQEGLDMVRGSAPFSLALVDWNMPVLNGYDFVRAVRSNKDHNAMKIVMVTTEVETAQVVKALTAGADEYIMKPFTKEILGEKIGMLGLA